MPSGNRYSYLLTSSEKSSLPFRATTGIYPEKASREDPRKNQGLQINPSNFWTQSSAGKQAPPAKMTAY
jgi:hypothetical protein